MMQFALNVLNNKLDLNKKIILVNQVTGPLFIDIANAFSANDFDTQLYTGQIEKTYADVDSEVRINKCFGYSRSTFFNRISSWLGFTIQVFFKLLFKRHEAHLLFVSNPPLVPFIGLIFHKLFKQPYSVLIYDIYPDALINFGMVRKDSFIIKVWSKLNKSLFFNAHKVFTISNFMAETLKTYYGNHDNLIIIPNWVNNKYIKPVPRQNNSFIQQYSLQDKFIILYSGNMGLTHDIESIIEAASLLKEEKRIHFVFIGEGTKKEKVSKIVKERDLDNVLILPFQESSVMPFSMSSADISIVTLLEEAGTLSVPSKTYYMMAAGTAIIAIAPSKSELVHLVNEYKIGEAVKPHDAKNLAEKILYLSREEKTIDLYKKKSLRTSSKFTPANALLYLEHIEKMI